MKGARLIARPSVHNALFETADGGGVVYWQKLILCCSAGSASPRAINRTFRLAESLKNAATPESLLCRCEDVRCGDVAATDDWLQAKLTQRPLAVWLAAAAAEPLSPARAETLIALARLSAEP